MKGLKKQLDVKSAKDEKDTEVEKESRLTVGEVDERAMTGRSQFSAISKVCSGVLKIFTLILGETFQFLQEYFLKWLGSTETLKIILISNSPDHKWI